MSTPTLKPASALRRAWQRSLLLFTLWFAGAEVLVWAATLFVCQVPPRLMTPAPFSTGAALPLAAWLVGAGVITFLFAGVSAGARWVRQSAGLGHLLGPSPPETDQSRAAARLAGGLILLAATHLAMKHLAMPVTLAGHTTTIPLLARAAGRYLPLTSAALLLEMMLAVWWLLRVRSFRWWAWRTATGILWIVVILLVITGPNLFLGDALEWGARLRLRPIPQEWFAGPPGALAGWWPAVRVGLAGMLLVTLISVMHQGREGWRSWRAGRRRAALPPA